MIIHHQRKAKQNKKRKECHFKMIQTQFHHHHQLKKEINLFLTQLIQNQFLNTSADSSVHQMMMIPNHFHHPKRTNKVFQ